MTGPLISVDRLDKSYGRVVVTPVLKQVSLNINAGEFVAIMGPSGSGKSTFMNILGCLDQADAGTYELGGEDTTSLTADRAADLRNRMLGFVFQGFNLLQRRTALDNVALPMICGGLARDEWQPRARDLLDMVGLKGRYGAYPNQLSGGQQQRVAIARSLAMDPPVILADEPTGNLDSAVSGEIMRMISGLNTSRRITVVLVTHEADVAAYAKRLVKFRDGRIVYDGAVSAEGIAL
jgi:ABC-type lipoprotein export system ATPase subunit